ncbi:MAG: AAA family ATPase [Candidatus Moranbacteria bacterium]|nr:AAA family ATPase [Candidatus Moranbacteria bacterium]
MAAYLKNLNFEQLQAVQSQARIIQVVAGPGTGKTKTLIARAIWLLVAQQVKSSDIVIITFTQKAAQEIQERLQADLFFNQAGAKLPFIGTFHAFAAQINSKQKSIKNIASHVIKQAFVQGILAKSFSSKDFPRFSAKKLLNLISLQKTNSSQIVKKFPSLDQNKIKILTRLYNQKLIQNGLLDYDDLLIKALKIVKNRNSLSAQSLTFQYLFIDEFQDTNVIQYQLIKELHNTKQLKIFTIGDPLQAIYGFRGASDRIFFQFRQDFPQCQQIALQTNYRSTKKILQLAYSIFNQRHYPKSQLAQKTKPRIVRCYNNKAQAEFIQKNIEQTMGGVDLLAGSTNAYEQFGYSFADFAVIYRYHSQAAVLKKIFNRAGIPYQITGGHAFWLHSQVQFLIKIFQFYRNNDDRFFIELIQNRFCPLSSKLKAKLITGFIQISSNQKSLLQKIKKQLETKQQNQLNSKQKQSLKKFLSGLNKVLKFSRKQKLAEFAEFCLVTFPLLTSQQKPEQVSALEQFKQALLAFGSIKQDLEKFLNYYADLQQRDFYDPNAQKVTLTTMHAVKGLEFSYVFILDLQEFIFNQIPSESHISLDNDEEKRLLFTAITRAKNQLDLLYFAKTAQAKIASQLTKFFTPNSYQHLLDPQTQRIKSKIKQKKARQSQQKLF